MDSRWSVWLIPSIQEIKKYKQLIKLYSEKYSFSLFDPHVTLFGRIDIEPGSTFSFFEECVKGQDQIRLDTLDVMSGDPPWKSLYIQFKLNSTIIDLQSKINNKLGVFRDYVFDPHMSLAYGNIHEKRSELEDITLDESIGFSSVALVYTSDKIEDWKIIKKYKFTKSNI